MAVRSLLYDLERYQRRPPGNWPFDFLHSSELAGNEFQKSSHCGLIFSLSEAEFVRQEASSSYYLHCHFQGLQTNHGHTK